MTGQRWNVFKVHVCIMVVYNSQACGVRLVKAFDPILLCILTYLAVYGVDEETQSQSVYKSLYAS